MKRIIPVSCAGETLVATIDGPAEARIGWLFVTGGRQTRVGPHRLYERLARRMAEAGHAVIRFDRRGTGDSGGTDGGYLASGPELHAALDALKGRFLLLETVLGFGLCDGATALALHGVSLDGLVAANPWVVEPRGDLPPAAAIRGHYAKRLIDRKAWVRLLSGDVNLKQLVRGLARSAAKEDDSLVRRFADGVAAPCIVLAEGDGTAQAFAAAWKGLRAGASNRRKNLESDRGGIVTIPTASHSFADAPAFEALASAMLDHSAAIASASKSASAR
jgi:exosortase A-associated hydrolase 1